MNTFMQIMLLSIFWEHYVLRKDSLEEYLEKNNSILQNMKEKPKKCTIFTYLKDIANPFKLRSRL